MVHFQQLCQSVITRGYINHLQILSIEYPQMIHTPYINHIYSILVRSRCWELLFHLFLSRGPFPSRFGAFESSDSGRTRTLLKFQLQTYLARYGHVNSYEYKYVYGIYIYAYMYIQYCIYIYAIIINYIHIYKHGTTVKFH